MKALASLMILLTSTLASASQPLEGKTLANGSTLVRVNVTHEVFMIGSSTNKHVQKALETLCGDQGKTLTDTFKPIEDVGGEIVIGLCQ